MTPQDFIRKWKPVALTERATAQEHFIDLCRLFDHPTPTEDDPVGDHFAFEKGVEKVGGGDGWADVWKKGSFAWEYKKKKRDLNAALEQLTRYAAALENPPLHIACDTVRFRIETRWTNTVVDKYEFELADLAEPRNLEILRAVFHDPEALRPKQTRASLTRDAADKFQTISDRLQHRNPDREAVAHFVNQLVFCFFANSVKLLPEGLLLKLLDTCGRRPQRSKSYFDKLFTEMERGGEFDLTEIRWFNGGLFDGRRALPLEADEIGLLRALHSFRWDLIDPTIFGTLFERFLDPDKRAQIGAHYTDEAKIMLIVEPVILRPLRAEWDTRRAEIEAIMRPVLEAPAPVGRAAKDAQGKRVGAVRAKAHEARDAFVARLCGLRILDPACGSGNFLYLALQGVKDLEYRVILECETLGLDRVLPRVAPKILHGIEINPLAAELARTVIWIGDIQWGVRNAVHHRPEPILEKLDTIECRDALLSSGPDGLVEAEWPEAEFIVGNPPFLGGKLLRRGLGDDTVEALFRVYAGRVPAEADLVCYWFAKAWDQIGHNRAKCAGLVSTNSIRGGANRKVLEPIAAASAIFEAWSDEPWVVDGAAVRVSLVCFSPSTSSGVVRLNDATATHVNADLSGQAANLAVARRLFDNSGVAFMGDTKGGAFDVPGAVARAWLQAPLNPNGRPNSDVLKPWVNGLDVTRRERGMWIVDFGSVKDEKEVALYEGPFGHIRVRVKPERDSNRRALYQSNWWRHVEPRPGMWKAIKGTYVATPTVAKHRLFQKVSAAVCPDHQLIVIARDDDTMFGILHSRFHESWSLRLGTWLGVGNDPRYTPTTTFETFPFPEGLTPNIPAADYDVDPRAQRIAVAAQRLDTLRQAWLNPPDLVDIVPEVVPTAAPGEAPRRYPDRVLPKTVEAAVVLKTRTLTNLYNQRPQWLADAHEAIDRAVAAAYGWPEDIEIDDALARLLSLNLERSAAETAAAVSPEPRRGRRARSD